jgi:hypothetical protein
MVSIKTFREMALAFDEATESPHFEKTSFRVNSKVVVKFSQVDQSVFCSFDKTIIYPVPGKWGLQGWTIIELKKVKKEMLVDALTTSYCTVAPKKLAEKYKHG